MRTPVLGNQFRRDVKLAAKRGKDLSKLRDVLQILIDGEILAPRYRDHPLSGEWKGCRDCHLEPDWLLFFKIDGDDLHLIRTGTHSDLF